jgi:hypothetical protein
MRLDDRLVVEDAVHQMAAVADLHALAQDAPVQATAAADGAACADDCVAAQLHPRLDAGVVADVAARFDLGVGFNLGLRAEPVALFGTASCGGQGGFDLAAE